MADFPCFTERYLLTVTYYTVSDYAPAASGLYCDAHTAVVKVTNTGNSPLSACNLNCLGLSIPELNHRVLGYTHVPRFLHPIILWVENLHWDRGYMPSSSHTQPWPNPAHQALTASPSAEPPQHPLLVPPDSYSYTAAWSRCDASYAPGQEEEEWTTFTYSGHDFIRSFCPVYWTDSEVDVLGTCRVSDYTVYGLPVFSVVMDFLHNDLQAFTE